MKLIHILIVLLLINSVSLFAQKKGVTTYFEHGYNKTSNNYFSLGAIGNYQFIKSLNVIGGVELSTTNSYAASLSEHYSFYSSGKGLFYFENRYLARFFPNIRTQEHSFAFSGGYSNPYIDLFLGLHVKLFGSKGEYLFYFPDFIYKIEATIFPKSHFWNIGGRVSNADYFIIERYNMPRFSLFGNCKISPKCELFGVCSIIPAGVFNISAQFWGLTSKIGVRYLW